MQQFKNLIFDLGNVIIDIDYATTVSEFQKLAVVDFKEVVSYTSQHRIFDLFETGKISTQQFRDELKKFLKPGTSDEQIDNAWNAILIDYPQPKFELLKELKTKYKTFALSNINEIHVEAIHQAVKNRFDKSEFKSYFHTVYYSNEMGYRKPDKEIYKMLIEKENLNVAETFFVDDKAENIETAISLGLKAFHLKQPSELFGLLKNLEII